MPPQAPTVQKGLLQRSILPLVAVGATLGGYVWSRSDKKRPTKPEMENVSLTSGKNELQLGLPYPQNVLAEAPLLGAAMLDGDPDLSMNEGLAVGQVLDDFQGRDYFPEQSSSIKNAMIGELKVLHEKLTRISPAPQLVHLDLSDLKFFYEAHFKAHTREDYAQWSENLIRLLEGKFTLGNGEKLNVRFVLERPTEASFTTVRFSAESFKDFILSDDAFKVKCAEHFLNAQDGTAERRDLMNRILPKLRESLPPQTPEREVLLKLAETPEFVHFLEQKGKEAIATTLTGNDNDFGNASKDDVIWISLDLLDLSLRMSLEMMAGREKGYGTFAPFIGADGQLAEIMSQVAAHELGHALGLEHPSRMLGRLTNRAVIVPHEVHLMDRSDVQDYMRPLDFFFSPFALHYLQNILGVRRP